MVARQNQHGLFFKLCVYLMAISYQLRASTHVYIKQFTEMTPTNLAANCF